MVGEGERHRWTSGCCSCGDCWSRRVGTNDSMSLPQGRLGPQMGEHPRLPTSLLSILLFPGLHLLKLSIPAFPHDQLLHWPHEWCTNILGGPTAGPPLCVSLSPTPSHLPSPTDGICITSPHFIILAARSNPHIPQLEELRSWPFKASYALAPSYLINQLPTLPLFTQMNHSLLPNGVLEVSLIPLHRLFPPCEFPFSLCSYAHPHPFIQQTLMSAYYVLSTILSTGDPVMSRTKSLCSGSLCPNGESRK